MSKVDVVLDVETEYSAGEYHSLGETHKVTVKVEPEVLLAQALLTIEPEKIEGGSPPRQEWMGLISWMLVFLSHNKYNVQLFKDTLQG